MPSVTESEGDSGEPKTSSEPTGQAAGSHFGKKSVTFRGEGHGKRPSGVKHTSGEKGAVLGRSAESGETTKGSVRVLQRHRKPLECLVVAVLLLLQQISAPLQQHTAKH